MNEEELEQKAEDYARYTRIKDDKTYQSFDDECISEVQDYEGNYIYFHNRIERAYKDGYEQGKKETEVQIERMKCCENCKHYKYDCANGYDCDLGVIDKWKTYHKKCNKWEMAE